jgi:hypothetical protein
VKVLIPYIATLELLLPVTALLSAVGLVGHESFTGIAIQEIIISDGRQLILSQETHWEADPLGTILTIGFVAFLPALAVGAAFSHAIKRNTAALMILWGTALVGLLPSAFLVFTIGPLMLAASLFIACAGVAGIVLDRIHRPISPTRQALPG